MSPWRGSKRIRSPRAPVSFINPCLPTLADKAPSADGWVHEIKHDGYRLQIHARDGRVKLYTMTGVDWTERYPSIVEDVARLKLNAIFDAEAVCAGTDGVTDFNALHSRCREQEVFAYAFDVMMLDGDDVRRRPFVERKAALAKALRRARPGIRYSEHIAGDGAVIFEHACKLKLEGIVSKRLSAPYKSGRCKSWVKVKNKASPAYMRIIEGTV